MHASTMVNFQRDFGSSSNGSHLNNPARTKKRFNLQRETKKKRKNEPSFKQSSKPMNEKRSRLKRAHAKRRRRSGKFEKSSHEFNTTKILILISSHNRIRQEKEDAIAATNREEAESSQPH